LQIPSTLAFTLAESVGSLWMIDLHSATATATPAAVDGMDGMEVDVDVVGEVDVFAAGAGLGAAVEVAAGVLVAVELLVVELLLPQPATSAPQSSPASSSGDRVPIIGPP
jgi:hypothetical protein